MLFRVQVFQGPGQGPGSGFRSSRDRIGKDYSHSCESEKIGWLFEVKRRSENCYVLIRKRHIKAGKHIAA